MELSPNVHKTNVAANDWTTDNRHVKMGTLYSTPYLSFRQNCRIVFLNRGVNIVMELSSLLWVVPILCVHVENTRSRLEGFYKPVGRIKSSSGVKSLIKSSRLNLNILPEAKQAKTSRGTKKWKQWLAKTVSPGHHHGSTTTP